MKKFRIEYMYPNIDDEDKLYNMENDISFWSKSRLDNHLLRDNEKKLFDCLDLQKDIWKFDINRTSDNVKKATRILSLMPLYIPEYLIKNSLYIMSELVGEGRHKRLFGARTKEFWNYTGKNHLAVFLLVIEELLKNGINCDELLINHDVFLIQGNNFRSVSNSSKCINSAKECKYNPQITDINKEAYEKHFEYMNFYDLQTFLDNIIKLCERESYIEDEESKMPNPKSFNFRKHWYTAEPEIISEFVDEHKFCNDTFEDSSSDDFVNVVEYCKNLKEKLHNSGIQAERKVTTRHVDEILEKIFKCSDEEEKENYINKLKELLNECDNVIKEEMLDRIQEKLGFKTYVKPDIILIDEKAFGCKGENKNKSNTANKDVCAKVDNLEKEITELKENYVKFESLFSESFNEVNDQLKEVKDLVKEQNRRLEELETNLYNYFENGGKLPIKNMKSVPKQKIEKMIKDYTPKSIVEKLRKYLAIISLCMIVDTGLNIYDHIPKTANENAISVEQSNDGTELSDETLDEEDNKDKVIDNEKDDYETKPESYVKNLRIGKEIYSGDKQYYLSIYDKNSSGITSKDGIIIAYYPMVEEEGTLKCLGAIRNNEDVEEFFTTYDKEELEKLKWKVAVTSGEFPELEKTIEDNIDTNSKYTSFFFDFDMDNGEVKKLIK